jgi:hypothetical protein
MTQQSAAGQQCCQQSVVTTYCTSTSVASSHSGGQATWAASTPQWRAETGHTVLPPDGRKWCSELRTMGPQQVHWCCACNKPMQNGVAAHYSSKGHRNCKQHIDQSPYGPYSYNEYVLPSFQTPQAERYLDWDNPWSS